MPRRRSRVAFPSFPTEMFDNENFPHRDRRAVGRICNAESILLVDPSTSGISFGPSLSGASFHRPMLRLHFYRCFCCHRWIPQFLVSSIGPTSIDGRILPNRERIRFDGVRMLGLEKRRVQRFEGGSGRVFGSREAEAAVAWSV